MTAVSKWVAAGSSAAVFTAGLFLGAPTAAAAPGDAACLQASTQFEAALSAAGITETTVARLESAAEAAAAAEAIYLGLLEGAAADPVVAELEAAEEALDAAIAANAAAAAALADAQGSGDPDVLADAEAAKAAAGDAEAEAQQAVTDLTVAYEETMNRPEILEASDALDSAVAEFEAVLGTVSLDEASATNLMGLFESFLAACNPDATPVSVTPAGAGAATGGTNKGFNVQTAAEVEPATHPGLALLAGLLAAGIVVPSAVAVRMRRLERTRK